MTDVESAFAVICILVIPYITANRPGAPVAADVKDDDRDHRLRCCDAAFVRVATKSGRAFDVWTFVPTIFKHKGYCAAGEARLPPWRLEPFERQADQDPRGPHQQHRDAPRRSLDRASPPQCQRLGDGRHRPRQQAQEHHRPLAPPTHVMRYLRRDFAQHMARILDVADTRMLMHHDQKYNTIDTTYARGPAAFDVAHSRGGELDTRGPRNAARAASYMEFNEQGFAVRGIVARTLEQEDGGVTVASSSNIAAIVETAKQGKHLGPQKGLELLKGTEKKLDKIAEEMWDSFDALAEAQGEVVPPLTTRTGMRFRTLPLAPNSNSNSPNPDQHPVSQSLSRPCSCSRSSPSQLPRPLAGPQGTRERCTSSTLWALTDPKYDSKDHPVYQLHHIKARDRGNLLNDEEQKALLRLRWLQIWLRVKAREDAEEKKTRRQRHGPATRGAEIKTAQEVPPPRGEEKEELQAAETMRLGKWDLNVTLRALIPYVCPLAGVTAEFLQVAHLVGHEDKDLIYLYMSLALHALVGMPWGLKRQEQRKETPENAMPFDKELHEIFDAGLAAFLPCNIAAYVHVLERFLAARIKAREPLKFEEDMLSKLGRRVVEGKEHFEAHELKFIFFGTEDDDLLNGIAVGVSDDSLPMGAPGYHDFHKINRSSVPNVVEPELPSILSFWRVTVVIIDYCFKTRPLRQQPKNDKRTQWALYFYKLLCVSCSRALAEALGQRPERGAEVVDVARDYAESDYPPKVPAPGRRGRQRGRRGRGRDDDGLVLVTYDDSLPADAAASARVHRANVNRRPNVVKEPLPTVWSFLHPVVVIIEYCFKAKYIAELDDDDTLWARHIYRLLFVTSGSGLAEALARQAVDHEIPFLLCCMY